MASLDQNSLSSAGPHAAAIERLFWIYMLVLTAVTVVVLASVAIAIWRRRARSGAPEAPAVDTEELGEQPPARELRSLDPRSEKQRRRAVIASTVLTVIALFVLLVESIGTTNALESLDAGPQVEVLVTGNQWWWQVRYLDPDPAKVFTTANELHVPVGKNVRLQLMASDVIHSFWAPNLQGKRDLIPGHTNTLVLRADKPGRYRSQCAEFCGAEHALMAMWIVVEPQTNFEAWLAHQRTSAREPQTEFEREGQSVFLRNQCATCHSIAGTTAQSNVGPDLTHLGSRIGLAAASYPNRRGYLAGWMLGAQALKPLAHMPNLELAPHDLQALLAYLESLQ
jgi:cytochrome c oxidase subunit 2